MFFGIYIFFALHSFEIHPNHILTQANGNQNNTIHYKNKQYGQNYFRFHLSAVFKSDKFYVENKRGMDFVLLCSLFNLDGEIRS